MRTRPDSMQFPPPMLRFSRDNDRGLTCSQACGDTKKRSVDVQKGRIWVKPLWHRTLNLQTVRSKAVVWLHEGGEKASSMR